MTEDISSLNNLREIILPEAPPFWPPAPGVLIILFFILSAIVYITYRLVLYRRKNRYRKAGLLLLDDVETVYELSVLLKRVALAVFPREQVASLHGQEWQQFLNDTCSSCSFSNSILSNNNNSTVDLELIDCARIWIKKHSVPNKKLRE